jgi:hypothetical protein
VCSNGCCCFAAISAHKQTTGCFRVHLTFLLVFASCLSDIRFCCEQADKEKAAAEAAAKVKAEAVLASVVFDACMYRWNQSGCSQASKEKVAAEAAARRKASIEKVCTGKIGSKFAITLC